MAFLRQGHCPWALAAQVRSSRERWGWKGPRGPGGLGIPIPHGEAGSLPEDDKGELSFSPPAL